MCIPIVNCRVYVSLCFSSADQYRIPSREEQEAVMDSFSSPSVGSGSSSFSSSELMDQVKTQLAQAYAQEFLETVRGKCFEKCITKPSSSLSGSESSCISRCVDRYIEATGIISRALFSAPH